MLVGTLLGTEKIRLDSGYSGDVEKVRRILEGHRVTMKIAVEPL